MVRQRVATQPVGYERSGVAKPIEPVKPVRSSEPEESWGSWEPSEPTKSRAEKSGRGEADEAEAARPEEMVLKEAEPEEPEGSGKNKETKMSKKAEKRAKKEAAKGRKKSKKWLWWFVPLVALFAGMLIFAGVEIIGWQMDNVHTAEQQEEVTEIADGHEVEGEGELINPPTEEAEPAVQSDYWYYTGLPFYEVNFDELKARNPDTVAFIHMSNNNVNYPVVQTDNNDYYLHHAFDGSYNDAGWIFMDHRVTIDPPDENTVIYGHGRYDNTMFGSLQNALGAAWQSNKDNYVIWLSTPTENRMYQIFSIYDADAENYYLKHSFADENEKAQWVAEMQARNVAPTTTTATAADQILTLSTCNKQNQDHRIVIQAKLIKRQAR